MQNQVLQDINIRIKRIEKKLESQSQTIIQPINALRLQIQEVYNDIMSCVALQIPFQSQEK